MRADLPVVSLFLILALGLSACSDTEAAPIVAKNSASAQATSDPVLEPSPSERAPVSDDSAGRIAFTRAGDIYSMRPDGSDVVRLTDHPEGDYEPDLSPDGTKIAFIRDVDLRHSDPMRDDDPPYERFDIFVMDQDGTNIERLTRDRAEERGLAWSPDGSYIAFNKGKRRNIWTLDVATREMAKLTNGKGDSYSPSWSPDGRHIVFWTMYRDCKPHRIDACENPRVYVMDPDGSDERLLIHGSRYGAGEPDYSPDGRLIVFTYAYHSQFDLYLAKSNGRIIRRLTRTKVQESTPTFSPAGDRIVYVIEGQTYVMDLQDKKVTQLTFEDDASFAPSWGPAPSS